MKILVVEDDRKVAGFIEQGLREEGYAVDVAPDGEEGTMLAHVYDYDVIIRSADSNTSVAARSDVAVFRERTSRSAQP